MYVRMVITAALALFIPLTHPFTVRCLSAEWSIPTRVAPGQTIRIEVKLTNTCKLPVKISGFEARIIRVKLLYLLNIPLNTKVMKVSYAEERVVPPGGELSLRSAQISIPWYIPPGEYTFNLITQASEGFLTNTISINVPLKREHELVLYLLALLILGVLMFSVPYGKEIKIRIRRVKAKLLLLKFLNLHQSL